MACTVEKVAVSVDRALLRRAERIRRVTGESRSALVSRALRRLVAAQEHGRRVEEYVAAYRRQPEAANELDLARAFAKRSVASVAWGDE